MTHSMTAFANRTGQSGATSWTWEIRGVNARGLDIRLRLPDGIDGLEAAIRAELTKRYSRGNITLSLRLARDDSAQALALDAAQLDRVLAALEQVQERAFAMGVTLAQPTPADVLAQRGVVLQGRNEDDSSALAPILIADFNALLDDFTSMRASEGAALEAVARDQLSQIDVLTKQAAIAAAARKDQTKANLKSALLRVVDAAPDMDEGRIAQELALIAVKTDVTEELDRLRAHITAAHALLDDPKSVGRKLDFLSQEFNREANTLCSKAQSTELTAIGLDLKAVIDQLREQIQNVE